MTKLVNITPGGRPDAIQIWAFEGPCTVMDVAKALNDIGSKLTGKGHVINIMSGTHGYCSGSAGAPATREQRFAEEDKKLAAPKTKDGQAIICVVHDFNNNHLEAPDRVTAALAKLNATMREICRAPGTHAFLLAYCCSAAK